MAKNYKDISYFEDRPDVVKIFNDLEAFLDFCRFELAPYDPADLYNKESWVWRNFERSRNPRRAWQDRKPRSNKNYSKAE